MLANFEQREGKEKAWTGKYENLHNLPHWHLECELIYVEKGCVTVSLNHTAYQLETGEAAFIDSGEIHYIKGSEDSVTTILMFDSSIIQNVVRRVHLLCPKLDRSLSSCSTSAACISGSSVSGCSFSLSSILDVCLEIKRELKEKPLFYSEKIQGTIRNLMIDIYRSQQLGEVKPNKYHNSMENYKNLLREIEEKFSYMTFEDGAEFMGLSQPYFSRFFKNISGMTFSRYLNIIRLEKAIEMLNHNTGHRSVTEIASACGFDTIRHFNRSFKELTGFSPRELPKGYVLTSRSIKSMKGNFNPTLPCSRLVEK